MTVKVDFAPSRCENIVSKSTGERVMRNTFIYGLSFLALSAGLGHAGGWSAGELGSQGLISSGSSANISIGEIDYKIIADTADNFQLGQTTNIDVVPDASRSSIFLNAEIGSNLNLGFSRFLSGSIQMRGGAGSFTSWIPDADADITAIALVGSYHITDNFGILAGVRNDSLANATVSTIKGTYSLSSASKLRGVLGFNYRRPDIALKISATYAPESEIKSASSFTETAAPSGVSGVSYGDAIISQATGATLGAALLTDVSSYTSTVGLPETLNLEFETGIAENTLLFGSILHQKWSTAQIVSAGSAASAITTSFGDSNKYNLGIGRKISDNLAISVSYTTEDGAGEYSGSLFTVSNGSNTVTLAGKYTRDNFSITAGISKVDIGGVTITSDGTASGNQYAKYGKNSALGVGIKVAYNF